MKIKHFEGVDMDLGKIVQRYYTDFIKPRAEKDHKDGAPPLIIIGNSDLELSALPADMMEFFMGDTSQYKHRMKLLNTAYRNKYKGKKENNLVILISEAFRRVVKKEKEKEFMENYEGLINDDAAQSILLINVEIPEAIMFLEYEVIFDQSKGYNVLRLMEDISKEYKKGTKEYDEISHSNFNTVL